MKRILAPTIIAIGLCFAATGASAERERSVPFKPCAYLKQEIRDGVSAVELYKRQINELFIETMETQPDDELARIKKAIENFGNAADTNLAETKALADIYVALCKP
jgi:hypothetical protein